MTWVPCYDASQLRSQTGRAMLAGLMLLALAGCGGRTDPETGSDSSSPPPGGPTEGEIRREIHEAPIPARPKPIGRVTATIEGPNYQHAEVEITLRPFERSGQNGFVLQCEGVDDPSGPAELNLGNIEGWVNESPFEGGGAAVPALQIHLELSGSHDGEPLTLQEMAPAFACASPQEAWQGNRVLVGEGEEQGRTFFDIVIGTTDLNSRARTLDHLTVQIRTTPPATSCEVSTPGDLRVDGCGFRVR